MKSIWNKENHNPLGSGGWMIWLIALIVIALAVGAASLLFTGCSI